MAPSSRAPCHVRPHFTHSCAVLQDLTSPPHRILASRSNRRWSRSTTQRPVRTPRPCQSLLHRMIRVVYPGPGTPESGTHAGRGSRTARRWPSPVPCSGTVVRLHTVPASRDAKALPSGDAGPRAFAVTAKAVSVLVERMPRTARNDQVPPTRRRMSLAPDAPGSRRDSGLARRRFEGDTHSREEPRKQDAAAGVGRTGVVDSRRGGGRSGIPDVQDAPVAIPSSTCGVNRVPAQVAGMPDLPTGPVRSAFPCTEVGSPSHPGHAAGGTYG